MFKVVIINELEELNEEIANLIQWEEYGCRLVGISENLTEGKNLIEILAPDIVFIDTTSSYLGIGNFIRSITRQGFKGQIIQIYSKHSAGLEKGNSRNAQLAICRETLTSYKFANILLEAIELLKNP